MESKTKQNESTKLIALDIDKAKLIVCVLQKDESNKISCNDSDFKYIILKDDKDSREIRNFQTTIYDFFDLIHADRIVILARQMKGRFKAASVSFKIESLLQCYPKVDLEFLAPQTLKAYFKKNELQLPVEHAYQEDAFKLGYYLLQQNEISN
ncbi:MAG: DUF3010 family protein [Saprospiraceae bacterium]|nr:DUF3010 family protein [Saprospiraceae bacterium]MBK7810070.1 DUF3010 family protein [Saprospiraceae bacterium]MBK9629674.1 DUF3010 family protein [Saprospiraceae bacterium]